MRDHTSAFLMLLFLALCSSAAPSDVWALGWNGLEPGLTTIEQVRERWGPPTRETRGKEEGYDTVQWVYEGKSAPPGITRATLDFGLLGPEGYKPQLLRALRLEPKDRVFPRGTVIDGWGLPDLIHDEDQFPVFIYLKGLQVFFDPTGLAAVSMLFSPPLPVPAQPPAAAPR
jgi:hypothetical protein